MFISPPSPASLVAPPPGQSTSTRSNPKRQRGLGLLRNSIQTLHATGVQTPPQTPSSVGDEHEATTLNTDSSPSSSSAAEVTGGLAPPRPAENQSIGYFPDLDSTPSAFNRARTSTLPCIEEDVVVTQREARSPGATSVISTASSTSSDKGKFSRSMARRRAGSFTSAVGGSVFGQNPRRGQNDNNNNNNNNNNNPSSSRGPAPERPPRPEESLSEDFSYANLLAGSMPESAATEDDSKLAGLPADQMPTIRFIPYQDPRSTKPSLAFTATSRTLPHEGCVIRVGRYSERDSSPGPGPNLPSAAPVGFKSKVVSRRHCEFWCSQGQWYVKDVKSSSGTFLNHIRLSQPSTESKPFPVNDSDIIQLGMDFRGGEESIFRCVKIRIECNRAWQRSLNNFK